MGVPGLFGWLRKKYPLIVRPASAGVESHEGSGNGLCENLYIDMNHIIHACTHPSWRCTPYLSEEEMFLDMQLYLNHLFETARPCRLFMVAMDGVAPQAKMNQQRTRRFFSAYREELSAQLEAEVRREMVAVLEPGTVIPELPKFDGNVITPGTAFMARLAAMLRAFFATKLQTDPAWADIAVVLSDSSEPGEGEHKIMRFIRHLRTLSGHDPNTRHVIYGQDADLILLALLTHEPHFAILREARRESTGEHNDLEDMLVTQQPLEYLDISVLRQFLRHEFAELLEPEANPAVGRPAAGMPMEGDQDGPDLNSAAAIDAAPAAFDFERLLEDFVLLTFLAGNDFLPNVPSLDIYDYPKSALDTLLETYKAVLPSSGYLTKSSKLNASSLRTLLNRLAADEQPAISRRQEQAARQHRRQMSKDADLTAANNGACRGFTGPDQSGQWVSMGELRPGESLEEALSGLSTGNGQTEEQQEIERLRSANPSQLRQELSRRVAGRLEDRLKGPALAEPITYRGNMVDYRSRHYQQRFGAEPGEGVEKVARKVSQAYIQTLAWSLVYYSHGTLPVVRHRNGDAAHQVSATSGSSFPCGAPWDWYYQYHYAPLMSDLAKQTGALGKIKSPSLIQPEVQEPNGSWAPQYGPVRPLLQLMAVLPPQSAECLPYKLARLLRETQQAHEDGNGASVAAALADMFPADLAPLIDMAGKRWAHTAVVNLPFADVKRLAAAAQQEAQDERGLTEEEEARNEFGAALLMLSGFHSMADYVRAWGEGAPLPEDSIDSCEGERDAESAATLLSLAVQPEEPTGLQESMVLEVVLDLAGVSTPPFSPHLLPGLREDSSGVTKRAWLDMKSAHRADIKSAALNGRGRGRHAGRPTGVPMQRRMPTNHSAPKQQFLGAAASARHPTNGFAPSAAARAPHPPHQPLLSGSNHPRTAFTVAPPNGAASSMAAGLHRPKPRNASVPESSSGMGSVPQVAAASKAASSVPHPLRHLANGHQQQQHNSSNDQPFPGPTHVHAPQPHRAHQRPQPTNKSTTQQSHQHSPEPLPKWPPGFPPPPPAARPAGTHTNAQGPSENGFAGPGGFRAAQQPPSGPPRAPAQQPPPGGPAATAPSRQDDALADMMSALLPSAAPARGTSAADPIADIMSFLLPPAVAERSTAAGQSSTAVPSSFSTLPATAAVSNTADIESRGSPVIPSEQCVSTAAAADTATGALEHLLGGLQPGASLSTAAPAGSVDQGRDGKLRIGLPTGGLKRHGYNPMQAAKPAQASSFS